MCASRVVNAILHQPKPSKAVQHRAPPGSRALRRGSRCALGGTQKPWVRRGHRRGRWGWAAGVVARKCRLFFLSVNAPQRFYQSKLHWLYQARHLFGSKMLSKIHFSINELRHITVCFRHFKQEKYFGYVHIARLCLLGNFFSHSPLTFFAGSRFGSLI
jgi:hypothetical protein